MLIFPGEPWRMIDGCVHLIKVSYSGLDSIGDPIVIVVPATLEHWDATGNF